ncbi:MAG: ZIP family metal transporter [Patescibacteria group bacterium]|nr:ZIP family metal transporter [Patescibacteria group bacterium]
MNKIYFYIIIASVITSLLSFVGVLFLSFSIKKLKKIVMFLVSLSAGALLGGAFLHLIPEALEEVDHHSNMVWFGILGGIILFFILEKIIHWRHCHEITCDEHPHPIGVMNLVGDGLHNLIDGMVIAGAFLVDIRLGVLTTVAVITHEIPQEIGDFGVLIHAGYSVKKALFYNFISASFSILGAIIVILLGTYLDGFVEFIIPITAGGFIYIASSDLIPELKKEIRINKSLKQLLGIIIGLGIMIVLNSFFHVH